MSFVGRTAPPSVLFDSEDDRVNATGATKPACFADLHLDQIVEAITANWAEYNLKPFFYYSLNRTDTISYRHEVFRDLESQPLLADVKSFATRMRDVRAYVTLANKLYYRFHKEAWLLHAISTYCDAIQQLSAKLNNTPIRSRGFLAFRDYLTQYATGLSFVPLMRTARQLTVELSNVNYCVLIRDNSLTVQEQQSQIDYSAEIEETFKKFQQGDAKDYRVTYHSAPEDMNHIEAKILEFVGRLNSDLFSRLRRYCEQNTDFLDERIAAFDREVHFYIAYFDHIVQLRQTGLQFCYPDVSATSKATHARDTFDLALAQKLTSQHATVVHNDFYLIGKERIIVVTGPNQGGKTTFARMFGQLHYLASLGCLTPGRETRLFLFDRIFTHFERQEKVETLRGKLEDDLARVHVIFQHATPQSIVIMNEIFTSTTIQDELYLSRRVMERLCNFDILCVWVTFLDELSSFNERTVSMVSTVVPDNPTLRTFKIARRAADGLAYAMAIVEKYGLTRDQIMARVQP